MCTYKELVRSSVWEEETLQSLTIRAGIPFPPRVLLAGTDDSGRYFKGTVSVFKFDLVLVFYYNYVNYVNKKLIRE